MAAPRRDWKALTIPLADVQAQSEDERCYRLSDQAVAVLLAMAGYAHWPTRWHKDGPLTDAERDYVDALASYIESRLMQPEFCGEEDMIDVRQNPEEPCLLEKSSDGGATWTTFADLRLCQPRLRRNPNTGHYNWTVDDITFYEFPDGPWTQSKFPPTLPPVREEAPDVNRCLAAANAAAALTHSYEDIGDSLFDVASDQFDLYETLLDGLMGLIGLNIPLLAYVTEMAALLAFQAAFDGSTFDSEDQEILKCILFENATDSDGIVTFDYSGVQDEVVGHYLDGDGMQWGLMNLMLPFIGEPGLNLAGGIGGITDADCEDCGDECTYFEPMTTALKPTTDIDGAIQPSIGGNWGAYQAADGRTGGGRIHCEGDGVHQVINVLLDLGEECEIRNSSLWLKVDYDPGAFVHLEWYYYADDLGLTGHGSLYNPAGWPLDWTQYFSVGTTTPTRYVVIDLWSDGSSDFSIDDIKVNLDDDHEF